MANLIRRRRSPLSALKRDSDTDESLTPRALRREIDQLFDEFLSLSPGALMTSDADINPSIEVLETDDAMVLRAELPGMAENDVHVEVDDDNVLTISGEKQRDETKEERGFRYSEVSYGQFVRAVQLPNSVDASKIEAKLENGVLELRIPKVAASRARAIPIGKRAEAKEQVEQVEAPAQAETTAQEMAPSPEHDGASEAEHAPPPPEASPSSEQSAEHH